MLFEIFSSTFSIASDLLDSKPSAFWLLWGKLLLAGVFGLGKQLPRPGEGLCALLKGIGWAASSLLVLPVAQREVFQEIPACTVQG